MRSCPAWTEYAIIDNGTVPALLLNVVYDKFTRYCKDYAIKSEVLPYAQFRKQLEHAEYFIEKDVVKRIGSEVRRVITLNYAQLRTRCDVSGLEISLAQPL